MTAVAVAGRPQDLEFASLNRKIVQLVMASAARASVVERGVRGMRLPQDSESLEHAFAPMFRGSGTMPRQLRRAFGRPGRRFPAGIDFGDRKSVIEQAVASNGLDAVKINAAVRAAWHSNLSPQDMGDLISSTMKLRSAASGGGGGAPTAQSGGAAKELRLMIERVQCVERVGWEATDWDGKDVILCGGVGFDSTLVAPPPVQSPSTAHFKKVPKFTVGGFDNDGAVRNFHPDKVFCKWDLTASGPWPRAFVGIIALGEQDSGDEFPKLLEDIWAMLAPVVIAAVSALVIASISAGAGAAIGAAAGTPEAPLIGTAIGAAVGAVIGAIVGLVASTLQDDILETSDTPVTLMLPSVSDTMPGGGAMSDFYTAEYVRPGKPGFYNLTYYWHLVY